MTQETKKNRGGRPHSLRLTVQDIRDIVMGEDSISAVVAKYHIPRYYVSVMRMVKPVVEAKTQLSNP